MKLITLKRCKLLKCCNVHTTCIGLVVGGLGWVDENRPMDNSVAYRMIKYICKMSLLNSKRLLIKLQKIIMAAEDTNHF